MTKKIGQNFQHPILSPFCILFRVVADVWEKDVWEFQAKSGSSGSCRLFLHFLRKIAVQKMSGKTPGSPRHPSSRHPRPSDFWPISWSGAPAADSHGAWVGLINCLAARNLVLNFLNLIKDPNSQTPRGAIYKPPCVQLVNNPFLLYIKFLHC